MQFLAELDDQAAQEYLCNFKGVGPKTAACTLLFAFGKSMFPVDTHIHRIARRLKLIPPRATAERAHDLLKPMIAPKDRYEMHVLLIEPKTAVNGGDDAGPKIRQAEWLR